jgi:hypothetical protein
MDDHGEAADIRERLARQPRRGESRRDHHDGPEGGNCIAQIIAPYAPRFDRRTRRSLRRFAA